MSHWFLHSDFIVNFIHDLVQSYLETCKLMESKEQHLFSQKSRCGNSNFSFESFKFESITLISARFRTQGFARTAWFVHFLACISHVSFGDDCGFVTVGWEERYRMVCLFQQCSLSLFVGTLQFGAPRPLPH